MATLSGGIGNGSKWLLDKIVGVIAATGINPNLLTFLGLVVNFGAAAFFSVGRFFAGALIIFFAGFLDILDGQVARRQNRVTAFGAFYDSTLDRYADMALYMGLLVYYSVTGRTHYVVLAAVVDQEAHVQGHVRVAVERRIVERTEGGNAVLAPRHLPIQNVQEAGEENNQGADEEPAHCKKSGGAKIYDQSKECQEVGIDSRGGDRANYFVKQPFAAGSNCPR